MPRKEPIEYVKHCLRYIGYNGGKEITFLLWQSLHLKSNNQIVKCVSDIIPDCYLKKSKNRILKDAKCKS